MCYPVLSLSIHEKEIRKLYHSSVGFLLGLSSAIGIEARKMNENFEFAIWETGYIYK